MTFKVIWVEKVKIGKKGLVRAITFEGWKLGSLNLANIGTSWLDLGWDCIWWDLTVTFKVIWGQNFSNWHKNGLFRKITFEGLKLGSQNLHIRCIMARSRIGFVS